MKSVPSPSPEILPAFRWNPAMQRRFVEVMAETGSARVAAASVSKTHRAAYQLRKRPEGRWFGICWDAAVLVMRRVSEGGMMDAALQPIEYIGMRNTDTQRLSWRRADPALGRGRGMALLTRLDNAVATIAADAERYQLVIAVSSDFDNALGLLGSGASDAGWHGFFDAARASENNILCGYLHAFPPVFAAGRMSSEGPGTGAQI
jgi:hypothetical protein